jgi:hypothetical protein
MKRLLAAFALAAIVTPTVAATRPKSSAERHAATASLRAVRSALDAGATLDEFRRYQIESRIKIDAMPNTAANRDVREVSDLFNAAVQFAAIGVSGDISGAEISSAKAKYGSRTDDVLFKGIIDALDTMTAGAAEQLEMPGLGPNIREDIRYKVEKNRIAGEQIARLLIASANEKLLRLK